MPGHYWPFIDYPMYKGAIMEGERIPVRTIVMVRDSPRHEAEITADMVGLGIYRFENMVKVLMTSNDKQPDVINLLTRNLENSDNLVELDILNYPLVITKSGAKEAPSDLLKRIKL